MGILSTAAWLEIAGALLIALGFTLKAPAEPGSLHALAPTALIVAGTASFIFGVFKADLHPTWFKIGGVMLLITGIVGKNVNPPTSIEYEIASIFLAIGLVVFVQGVRKARAVQVDMGEDAESAESDSPPPPEK